MAKYALESRHYNKLIKWAQINGLEVQHGRTNAEAVISLIQAAFPDITEVELEEDGDNAPLQADVISAETGVVTSHYKCDPKVVVNIPTDAENGGAQPVPVCVNGDFILIKRNTDVQVPYRFYLSLKNAVQTDYRQEPGPNGTTLLIGEDRHAIRFSTLESPSRAEIAAWHERTKDIGRDKSEDEALKPGQSNAAIEAIAGALLRQLQAGAAAA